MQRQPGSSLSPVGREDPAHEAGQQSPGSAQDTVLLERARSGEVAAWEQLVDRYVGDVWAWAVEAAPSQEEAERVSRLVWLRLAQVLPWAPSVPLSEWLQQAVSEESGRVAAARGATRRRPSGNTASTQEEPPLDSG